MSLTAIKNGIFENDIITNSPSSAIIISPNRGFPEKPDYGEFMMISYPTISFFIAVTHSL